MSSEENAIAFLKFIQENQEVHDRLLSFTISGLGLRMIYPLHHHIIVRPNKLPEKTSSGLYLPYHEVERPQIGIVVYAARNSFLPIGTEIIFPKFWERFLYINGEKLLIMQDKDALAVVEM